MNAWSILLAKPCVCTFKNFLKAVLSNIGLFFFCVMSM